jgi:hypothetical protein
MPGHQWWEEMVIVSAADERNVTAQELYKAIRSELGKLHQFSGSSTNEIEKLAHAYAMVSEAIGLGCSRDLE